MVLFVGDYNEDLAIHSVEFATLGLLAGMMMKRTATCRPRTTSAAAARSL